MRHAKAPLTLALTGAILALPAIARAEDATVPCLSPAEFTALASYTLPSIINGVSQRCTSSLPPDAFLRTGAGALADRYAQAKPAAWPGAKAALLKLGSGSDSDLAKVVKNLPDAAQQQLVDTLVAGAVVEKLPLERCAPVSKMLHLMASLPPESTAEVVGLAVGLGSRMGTAHVGKFTICTQ